MTDTGGAWIASRVCPACGQVMTARAGVTVLVCPACPTAIDVSGGVPVRLLTCRPRAEQEHPSARLAFFYFRRGGDQPAGGVWVPGFRAIGARKRGRGAGELLTDRARYAPELVEAPLGAAVTLDLAQARARLRSASQATSEDGGCETPVVLVSLGCRVKSGTLREPVTGWTWPADRLLPPLGLPDVPPARVSRSAASEAAQRGRRARAAGERRRTLDKIKKIFSPGA